MVAGTLTLGTILGGGGQIGAAVHQREQLKSGERASRRAQDKANKLQAAQTGAQRARARRKAIAANRVAAARNISLASQVGISGSSAPAGAISALSSNLASSFASENRAFVTGQATFDVRQQGQNALAKAQRRAGTTGAVGGLFSQATSVGASFI